MQSVLHTLDGFGGIYIAMFVFALISGVFPLANSEAALIALGAASKYGWPKLIILACIVAVAQSITHAVLYQSGKGVANGSKKKRPKLEARIEKARALGKKWEKSELLLIFVGATIGIPPQILIAFLAGIIGIKFRTFVSIDLVGRIMRFVTIVSIAHAAA